ncbi:AI-2E family transporter [Halomonas korlensis]|uniref:Predicted PurR-regulated permease PerM n=1 Tax=Halomonas korlensis TaxID=463301 RepID=A0A1I7IKY9_9GAMM|nr:AI-2E family transporter [Halomonas korlensis]SFU73592.1 Predicted PurR-regulated permease PerM [Halomonas korlensis]
MPPPSSDPPYHVYARKVWIAVGIVGSVMLLAWFVWSGLEIILMSMIGLLLALFLYLPANFIHRHSFLGYRWALVVVLLLIITLMTLFGLNFSSNIAQQSQQFTEIIPGSLDALENRIRDWPMGDQFLREMEDGQSIRGALGDFIFRVTSIFSTTFGALTNLIVILFVGLYVAFEPWTYRRGLVRLVFPKHRDAASNLLAAIYDKMSWWLLGRLVSMLIIGVITGVGLWIIGIPLALSLGLLAGALAFIPYLGPILSAIPALLVGFTVGYAALLYVAMLFVMVQFIESYLVTPYIQKKAVQIPPALLIVVQFWLSLIGGLLGLLLAGPLTVLVMVIVDRVYINGWLQKE